MKEFTCWYCHKTKYASQMANACDCSTIKSKNDKWVNFKITDAMIGTCTCTLAICNDCDSKYDN